MFSFQVRNIHIKLFTRGFFLKSFLLFSLSKIFSLFYSSSFVCIVLYVCWFFFIRFGSYSLVVNDDGRIMIFELCCKLWLTSILFSIDFEALNIAKVASGHVNYIHSIHWENVWMIEIESQLHEKMCSFRLSNISVSR